jgi:tight adherence protein B
MLSISISVRDILYALALSGIFVGIMLFISGINYLIFTPLRQRRKMTQRLESTSKEHQLGARVLKAIQNEQSGPLLTALEKAVGETKIAKLKRQLLQANIYWGVGKFLCLVGILASSGFILGVIVWHTHLMGGILALAMGLGPFLYLRQKRRRKTRKFENQMPDAMELLARSLRAGHTLPSAIELVSQEVSAPLGIEMQIAYEEQRFGLSIAEALVRMLDRVDSQDLRYFVTAVLIQTETGGNLTEVMEKIGHLIRARLNFRSKVRGHTAEGRMSAIVLMVLPVVLFFILILINPHYELTLVQEELGRKFLAAGIISMLLGWYVMHKIIKSIEA